MGQLNAVHSMQQKEGLDFTTNALLREITIIVPLNVHWIDMEHDLANVVSIFGMLRI